MTVAPRVDLVGLLGQGNLGNDGSLEAVFAYLGAEHPHAILDFLCTGTDQMMARYGVPATRLRWYNTQTQRAPGMTALAAKSLMVPLGMIVDAFRIGTWVRRHDVVMVPGMGVLETSLPLRSWHTPYSMFLVCAFGRLFGTKVALVSLGANDIRQPLARRLVTAAARLAYYRSFRDTFSRTRCDEWASTPREMLAIPILHSLFRHLAMSQLSQEWSALVLWTITAAMTTVGRRISFMPPTLRR